jgi:hypothetical protein
MYQTNNVTVHCTAAVIIQIPYARHCMQMFVFAKTTRVFEEGN